MPEEYEDTGGLDGLLLFLLILIALLACFYM